jgi:hypothetical protein
MTTQPVVCIVSAVAKDNANLVWAAQGKGPDTFSRRLTDDPAPTTGSTVTHYLMADSSCSIEDVAAWQALANGDLPAIVGAWGQDGVIGAAEAQAACSGANLQVYSASGDVVPLDHANAILASRGLSFVPDEL